MSRRRDRRKMGEALALAGLNCGLTGENPSVGCVILDADGHPAGAGVTGRGGRPHAEEVALAEAGPAARGGTAYVTLEPCRQRTSGDPGCAARLSEAGLARVVCAIADPHPSGTGGIRVLRVSGARVEVGLKGREAARLYRSFFASVSLQKAPPPR